MKKNTLLGVIAALLLVSIPTAPTQAVETKKPTITLSANGKTIVATPLSLAGSTYKWLLNGKAATGSKNSFAVNLKNRGAVVTYVQTAAKKIYTSNSITVGQVQVVGTSQIAYSDATNSKITIKIPSALPAGAKAAVQWFRGPFDVKGATGNEYVLATADEDSDIYAVVTYSLKGYDNVKAESNSITVAKKPRTYQMIWSDEFNSAVGSSVDPGVWIPQNGDGVAFGNKGWGNAERQWYTESNSSVDSSGALVINATRKGADAFTCYYKAPCEWLSSKFVTKDKVGFKYGRIEARIKGSVGKGTWGAFWLLGANIDTRQWPGCGEIDVTELLGRDPSRNYGTLHGPQSGGGGRGGITDVVGGFANDYHTYAIDWLPDQITWYLDGKAYATQNKVDNDWVFDHEFYLIMNLAMGGNFGGGVDDSVTSATMGFDYIRAFSINGVGEVIKH